MGQGQGTYVSFRVLSVLPCDQPERQSLLFDRFPFFLLPITRSGRLAEIRWSIWIFCVSFSRMDSWLCINPLIIWSNLNFLNDSQRIILPTQSCLVYALIHCIRLLFDRSFRLYHHIIYICYFVTYYFFHSLEFFTSTLPDAFSLEFEWQQVSLSLQDSCQYSGRSQ